MGLLVHLQVAIGVKLLPALATTVPRLVVQLLVRVQPVYVLEVPPSVLRADVAHKLIAVFTGPPLRGDFPLWPLAGASSGRFLTADVALLSQHFLGLGLLLDVVQLLNDVFPRFLARPLTRPAQERYVFELFAARLAQRRPLALYRFVRQEDLNKKPFLTNKNLTQNKHKQKHRYMVK